MHKTLIVSPLFFAPENRDGVSKINYNILKKNEFYEADFLCAGPIPNIDHQSDHMNVKVFSINEVIRNSSSIQKFFRLFFTCLPQLILDKSLTKSLATKINELESNYDSILITTLSISRIAHNLSDKALKKSSLSAIDSLSLLFKRRYKGQTNLFKKFIFWLEYKKSLSFEKNIYEKYNKICFVSDIDKKFVDKHFSINYKTYAIPNGVDLDTFRPLKDIVPRDHQLIFTGNLSYGPNTEACEFLVYKLMPELLKLSNKYKLILAGNNPPEFLLKLNNPNIIVTGYVDDLNLLLNQSSLYLSPLFSGAGIKNKILEAMASGIFILGSKISFEGINNKLEHYQVVHDNSLKQWIQSIQSFTHNFNHHTNSKVQTNTLLTWENTQHQIFSQILKDTNK